jgi:hypothetical protein
MSSSGAGAVPATQSPSPGRPAPAGVVTLIVGEVGRASASRSKARPGASRADAAKASGPPGTASGSQAAKSVSQWSVRWSAGGPGPLLPSAEGEPDLTLTIGTDDAHRVKQGELGPSVAFMQGKLKSTGSNALLLSILAWSATPAFPKALAEWSAGLTS